MLQRVAMCCSALQCVAVCCSVLQLIEYRSFLQKSRTKETLILQRDATYSSVLSIMLMWGGFD